MLTAHVQQILALPIGGHCEPFAVQAWDQRFGEEHPPVVAIVRDHPSGFLTRADLGELGTLARSGDESAQLQVLVGTMMWGYSTKGGRSYRNTRTALNDKRVRPVLQRACQAICDRDIVRAYEAFSRPFAIKGYHESFFTKYVYFTALGDKDWPDDLPRPLILDSRVLTSLGFLCDLLGVDWGNPSKGATCKRYLRYCQTLHNWALELNCRADQIERFLFEQSFLFDATQYLRPLAIAVSDAIKHNDPPLQAAFLALPGDFRDSITLGPS